MVIKLQLPATAVTDLKCNKLGGCDVYIVTLRKWILQRRHQVTNRTGVYPLIHAYLHMHTLTHTHTYVCVYVCLGQGQTT